MYTCRLMLTAVLGGFFLCAAPASAQIDPEGGDVWVPPPPDATTTSAEQPPEPPPEQPPPATAQQQEPQPWYRGGPTGREEVETPPSPPEESEMAPAAEADGRDDHERVVGRLGVGFMGASVVPIANLTGGTVELGGSVTTPALGARYWLSDLVGIDVGLGIGFLGGNIDSGGMSVPVNSAFAMLIHGGVPLAVFHEQHYKFLIIPEVNIGFATGTAYGFTPDQDRGRSGFLFQLGGRIGTEIHFGFMDIPQLSLQASVGLFFEYASAGLGADRAGSAQGVSANTYSLATSVQGEPWDILLGALTALYYF